MKKLLLTTLAVSSLLASVQASEVANSKSSLCANHKSKTYAQELLSDTDNMLSFTNHGGLINGGVCWWHSRFTRNATYLAVYRPDLRAPTVSEAKDIIKQIRKGKKLVTIPGYESLADFSRAFSGEIQAELERWQKGDGFIRQQWIVGLAGTSETTAENLKSKMDELYEYVALEGNIAYQKLQLPGVTSHAWLVSGMKKTADGYEMTIVDSNYPYPYSVDYYEGMTSLNYAGFGNFVPYLERVRELNSIKKVLAKNCR